MSKNRDMRVFSFTLLAGKLKTDFDVSARTMGKARKLSRTVGREIMKTSNVFSPFKVQRNDR